MQARMGMMASSLQGWSGGKFNKLGKKIEMAEKALQVAQGREVLGRSIAECAALEKELDELFE